MRLFRCENENCDHREFESKTGECPGCHGFLVQELVYVHYIVPADGPIRTGIGNRMIACDPTMTRLPQASSVRAAVSCPHCKASVIFQEDECDKVDHHVPLIERITARKQGLM